MKKDETNNKELDIAGLLALKGYERPAEGSAEKNIQNIMRRVRSSGNIPSLLLFPDKSSGWMFAQPRYGVAALFIIFLGLHLIDRPLPSAPVGAGTLRAPEPAEAVVAVAAAAGTNHIQQGVAGLQGMQPSPYTPFTAGAKPVFTSFTE